MDNITLFCDENGPNPEFSNAYIAPMDILGAVYNSVEHYLMFEKARLFDPDGEAIKEMSNDKTPAQMIELGRQVKNFDPEVWDSVSREAMYEGLLIKYTQHKDLRTKLEDTRFSVLAAASPLDQKWGIGVAIDAPEALQPEKWTGKNWLGLILTAVRGELRYGFLDPDGYLSPILVDWFEEEETAETLYNYYTNPIDGQTRRIDKEISYGIRHRLDAIYQGDDDEL
jgi:ribA/ribD-fused uncharacterized protein